MSRGFSWFISRIAVSVVLYFLWSAVYGLLFRNNIKVNLIVDLAVLLFIVIAPFLVGRKNGSADMAYNNNAYLTITFVKILVLVGLLIFILPSLVALFIMSQSG